MRTINSAFRVVFFFTNDKRVIYVEISERISESNRERKDSLKFLILMRIETAICNSIVHNTAARSLNKCNAKVFH